MRDELRRKIAARFPDVEVSESVDWPVAELDSPHVHKLLQFLKSDDELAFDHLSDLAGVDYLDRLEVVYHLYSYSLGHKIRVKARVDRDHAEVPSVTSLWSTADWHEREAYDLYGIKFTGHPNLKRILCADDIGCFPFRKDIPLENREEWLLEDVNPKEHYGLGEWEW